MAHEGLMSTHCSNIHLKTPGPRLPSPDFAMFACACFMLKDERNGDFFLSARICVCVWCVCMCVSLCRLRVWPPPGESAVFPLLLILKAFQTSLGADSQGKTPLKGERAVRSPDFSVCSCSRKAGEGPPPPSS